MTAEPSVVPSSTPRVDPRTWPLTVRVVAATVLLSVVAFAAVGAYLSSVIADGLFEQRRDRVVAESLSARASLVDALRAAAGENPTQRLDAATQYVQTAGSAGAEDGGRELALVPVGAEGSVSVIGTDRTVTGLVDESFAAAVARAPDEMSYRSVRIPGTDAPGLLLGTRVSVAGAGSYDLYLLYSFAQEQQTLTFVQQVLGGAGLVLVALMIGVAVVVARLVATPLRQAARAAERIAGGDLTSRIPVSGADELARVGTSFNAMAQTLERQVADLTELSQVQQRFVSDVSHELRTPLTTIRMAAGMLREQRDGFAPDVRRTVELLDAQATRFGSLLEELLEISRFDAQAAELDAQEHDLVQLVDRAIDDAQVLAADRGGSIRRRGAPGPLLVEVDPRRIDRILRNLLTNAVEHGAGRPIGVMITVAASQVHVDVCDRGIGLTAAEAEHVFDRFWRADPSRTRTLGGSGLGLAISLEDAHLHGGTLTATGRPGKGATFRLTLPLRPAGPGGRTGQTRPGGPGETVGPDGEDTRDA